MELFVARARTARPHFELTEEAAPLVAEITRRVDGLPLAIELAAARVNVFGLTQLLSLVERRLGLLHGQPVADEARVALATLVEWSYDLLHADEKTLLQLLAVHRGGAGLESLVALADSQGLDEATVGYLLGALVDKSIVAVTFPGDEARYDLLGTIRQYALERLVESGRLGPVRAVHAEHFASLADAARSELRGPRWRAWIKRLRLENENLWAALTHAREAHDPALAVRLGAGLGLYFTLGERVSEGRRFVELALEASGGAPLGHPRAGAVPLLPRHRGARPRGGAGDRRACPRRRGDRGGPAGPRPRSGVARARARRVRRPGAGRSPGRRGAGRARGGGRRVGPRDRQPAAGHGGRARA